jgi:hypothetical protein
MPRCKAVRWDGWAAAVASGGRVAVLAVGDGVSEDRESAVRLGGLHGVSALCWGRSGRLLTACTTASNLCSMLCYELAVSRNCREVSNDTVPVRRMASRMCTWQPCPGWLQPMALCWCM